MNLTVALVGLFSALLGIGLSNGLATLLDLRRRRQRQTDLLCALHAEILAGIGAGSAQLSDEEQHYALSDETPFATPDKTDFVFENVRNDISILPVDVIHAVVQYYRLAMQSNLMTEDLRDPVFRSQPTDERRKFMAQLLGLTVQQRQAGIRALADIERVASTLNLDLEAQRRKAVATTSLDNQSSARQSDELDHA